MWGPLHPPTDMVMRGRLVLDRMVCRTRGRNKGNGQRELKAIVLKLFFDLLGVRDLDPVDQWAG